MEYPFFSENVQIFAHRGDSEFFPENTMPAFQSASEMGVDCIETDVHITRDGVCVVWHDDTLERIAGDPASICSRSLAELKKVDAGMIFSTDHGKTFPFRDKGLQIVTLEELLTALPDMRFNIDLKDKSKKLITEFVRIIQKHKAWDRVLGASFYYENLVSLRKLMPEMATSFAEKEVRRLVALQKTGLLRFAGNLKARAFQVPECHGTMKIVTGGIIKNLHRKNIAVHVWTINDEADMRRLLNMGVDGIFTDNPRLLIKALKRGQ